MSKKVKIFFVQVGTMKIKMTKSLENWPSQTKRLLRIPVYLSDCQIYTVCTHPGWQRPSPQNTGKTG